jgi:hypothetical protein
MAKKAKILEAVKALPDRRRPKRPSWEETFAVNHPKEWAEISELVDLHLDHDPAIIRKLPSRKMLWTFLSDQVENLRLAVGHEGFAEMMRRRGDQRAKS